MFLTYNANVEHSVVREKRAAVCDCGQVSPYVNENWGPYYVTRPNAMQPMLKPPHSEAGICGSISWLPDSRIRWSWTTAQPTEQALPRLPFAVSKSIATNDIIAEIRVQPE